MPLPRKPFFDSSSSDLSYLVDQAGVDFIKVVLDGRTRGPRAPAMKRSVGLNVTSHRGHDPKGVPRSLDKLIARIEKKMAPV